MWSNEVSAEMNNSSQFSRSVVSHSLRPHGLAAGKAFLSITNPRSLLKLMSFEPVMRSNHLILCSNLLLLPSIFPTIRMLSNELALHIRWPKYLSFSLRPCNQYSGLIAFRIDWFDLLAVQGTRQHHSSKASILWHPAFFINYT